MTRDNFDSQTIKTAAMRAAFICSNPDCKALTVGAIPNEPDEYKFLGVVAHINAASPGGARYSVSMTPEARKSIENALYLCPTCSVLIDKNNGVYFPETVLRKWKFDHENWTRSTLNKKTNGEVTIVDGEHVARGVGNVTALEINKPAIIKPGTRSVAEGIGNITATKIG